MDQLVVDPIHRYIVAFLRVCWILLVHVEPAILCVALSDIWFGLGAHHCLKLVAVIA